MMEKINSVVLIDDDEVQNFLNKEIIRRAGFEGKILTFEDATLALEQYKNGEFRDHFPQLLLVDIFMPIMDGFSFLEELNHLEVPANNDLTIFVLSSSANPDDINRSIQTKNCSGFLQKPLMIANLNESLMVK